MFQHAYSKSAHDQEAQMARANITESASHIGYRECCALMAFHSGRLQGFDNWIPTSKKRAPVPTYKRCGVLRRLSTSHLYIPFTTPTATLFSPWQADREASRRALRSGAWSGRR